MDGHNQPSVINNDRSKILNSSKSKYDSKGIVEGLKTTKYTIKKLIKCSLYTHFIIDHPKK
jgi:hypothetical protein